MTAVYMNHTPSVPLCYFVSGGHSGGLTIAGRFILDTVERKPAWRRKRHLLRMIGGYWTVGTWDRLLARAGDKGTALPHEVKHWMTAMSASVPASPAGVAQGAAWIDDATVQVKVGRVEKRALPKVFQPYVAHCYQYPEDWCSDGDTQGGGELSYAYTDSVTGEKVDFELSSPGNPAELDYSCWLARTCGVGSRKSGVKSDGITLGDVASLANPSTHRAPNASAKLIRNRLNSIPLRSIESFLASRRTPGGSPRRGRVPAALVARLARRKSGAEALLKEKAQRRVGAIFAHFDKDADGRLSQREFDRLLHSLAQCFPGQPVPALADEAFADLCADLHDDPAVGISPAGLTLLYLSHLSAGLRGTLDRHFSWVQRQQWATAPSREGQQPPTPDGKAEHPSRLRPRGTDAWRRSRYPSRKRRRVFRVVGCAAASPGGPRTMLPTACRPLRRLRSDDVLDAQFDRLGDASAAGSARAKATRDHDLRYFSAAPPVISREEEALAVSRLSSRPPNPLAALWPPRSSPPHPPTKSPEPGIVGRPGYAQRYASGVLNEQNAQIKLPAAVISAAVSRLAGAKRPAAPLQPRPPAQGRGAAAAFVGRLHTSDTPRERELSLLRKYPVRDNPWVSVIGGT